MKKIIARFFAVLLFIVAFTSITASALVNVPYSSYTYSYDGEAQLSPHAYVPALNFSSVEGLSESLAEPADIVTDKNDKLYIADSGNNRIVVLNSDYTLYRVIDRFECNGRQEALSNPQGVFVTDDGATYISDTGNQRIVSFTDDFTKGKIIPKPESALFDEGYEFKPKQLAVDKVGRLFVLADGINMGILVIDADGDFKNFFGCQKVQYNPIELLWRNFMTDEQIDRTFSFVPTEYNSVCMDSEGFIYVTSSAIDRNMQYSATISKSTDDQYAPVKRFGAAGVDVLYRNGGYPPSGDISVSMGEQDKGPSAIVDCVPGKYGTYTLLDSNRNKLFTYDSEGNLLYAYGGTGSQTGLFEGLCAAAVLSDNRMVCIDKTNNSVTVFKQTEYGALLFNVMKLHDERKYSEETAVWEQILLKNQNLDYAYVGLGKAMIKDGQYKEAMELFQSASNKSYYSIAFKEYRKELFSDFMLLIPVVIIALVVGVMFLFSRAKKHNQKKSLATERHTLADHLIYAAHVIFHPFDGFWDLNHEKRGGLGAALLIFILTCGTLMLRSAGSGYLFSEPSANIWSGSLTISILLLLFVIANWSITSLMDGKGTFKQITISACYSLTPMILLTLPQIVISHFLLLEESSYITILSGLAFVWCGFLLFTSIIVVHQYSLLKSLLTALLILFGMVIIVVLALMFFNLLEPMVTFFVNYYKELVYRF